MKKGIFVLLMGLAVAFAMGAAAYGRSEAFKENTYDPGTLKPRDSVLNLKVGEAAPDFMLPAVSGGKVSLSRFREKKNVALSFVPAAWTPECSLLYGRRPDGLPGGPFCMF